MKKSLHTKISRASFSYPQDQLTQGKTHPFKKTKPMKRFVIFSVCYLCSMLLATLSIGQTTKSDINNIINSLKSDVTTNKSETMKQSEKSNLVNPYTFKRRFSKEFSNVLNGQNSFSTLNKYATLDINQANAKVAFSPYTFKSKDLYNKPFKFFGSIGLNGEIDNDNVFTIFNTNGYNKKFEVVGNFNFVINKNSGSKFIPPPDAYYEDNHKVLDAIQSDFYNLIDKSTTNEITKIDNKAALSSPDDAKKAILEKYADYEEKLSKDYWTNSLKNWVNISVAPYGWGVNNVLDTTNSIIKKQYYNASIKASYNILLTNVKKETSFYFNILGELSNKSSYTGLTPAVWNQIKRLSDTTYLISDTKNVFSYDSSYTLKYLPSFSVQMIKTFKIKDFLFGIDINNKMDFLVPNTKSGSNIVKNTFSYGLIIPFTNEAGERKINIEVFHQIGTFINSPIDGTNLVGVKFSVPILEK